MPADAGDAIVAQAQGIPLFAVETVRALIDRDVVQPIDGVYRLVGDIGRLEVPDSLHSLLAARLDVAAAADPPAGLGRGRARHDASPRRRSSPCPASTRTRWTDGLAELLRREVLAVTADPLSPERGSYVFAQELLRQVAYDTLSRRDRKARHLAVAAHLRRAFPTTARRSPTSSPGTTSTPSRQSRTTPTPTSIRDLAAQTLVRAAERAERTGAPLRASAGYADAADLVAARGDQHEAAALRHRAANAAVVLGDNSRAIALAQTAVLDFEALADARAAARAGTVLGRALRRAGRHTEAREVLTSALAVLRVDPDADTVTALEQLAGVENFAATPAAAAANIEALAAAEGLDSGPADLSAVLVTFGIYLNIANRSTEARMYFTRAGELAEQADNAELLGYALLNLANNQLMHDPAGAAVTLRRTLAGRPPVRRPQHARGGLPQPDPRSARPR